MRTTLVDPRSSAYVYLHENKARNHKMYERPPSINYKRLSAQATADRLVQEAGMYAPSTFLSLCLLMCLINAYKRRR